MDNFQSVEVSHSLNNLPNDECAFVLGQKLPFSDVLEQVLTSNILRYDVYVSFGQDSFFVPDDLGMVDYPHDITFVTDRFSCVLSQLVSLDRLQSVDFLIGFINAAIDY